MNKLNVEEFIKKFKDKFFFWAGWKEQNEWLRKNLPRVSQGVDELSEIIEKKLHHIVLHKDYLKWRHTNSFSLTVNDVRQVVAKELAKEIANLIPISGQCSKVSEGAEMDSDYLKDIIYCTTQYLGIPDKKVALLNKRLYDSLSPHLNHFFKEPESSQTPTNSGVSVEELADLLKHHPAIKPSSNVEKSGKMYNKLAQAILNRINSSEEGK